MLSGFLDNWYRKLPAPPRALGTVQRLIVLGENGEYEDRDAIELTFEGVAGDPRAPLVRVVNAGALLALCKDDSALVRASGDQVHVTLSVDGAILPAGAVLTIGAVILAVQSSCNAPDASFVRALGSRAARRVRRHNRLGLGGRRLLCKVLTAGPVRVGDKLFPKNVGIRFQP